MARFNRIAAIAAALALGAGVIAAEEPDTRDFVTFNNGRVVEGEILSETDTQLEMRVVVAGLSTVTTYNKSGILSIDRDVVIEEDSAASATPKRAARSDRKSDDDEKKTTSDNPNAARLYVIELNGVFGRDISQTPLQDAFDDAMESDPDAIVVRMDCDTPGGFDGLWRAEELVPIIEDAMSDGHRVAFWIERAIGGAAFLPLISPDIYFTSDGRMGGVGTLQDFDIGDKRVNEKQISLRLGHAEGIAIAGGYRPEIVRAMARQDYWLLAKLESGAPQLMTLEREPPAELLSDGWIVLSDDGDGKNEDTDEDIVRGRGNDVLNLDADLAQKLLVSDGVAEDLSDIAFALGLGSDYIELEGRGQKFLDDWSDDMERAIDTLQRLRQRADEIQPQRADDEARRQLGQKIRYLREMRSILTTYAEVLDPSAGQRGNLEIEIDVVKQQIQQLDNRRR